MLMTLKNFVFSLLLMPSFCFAADGLLWWHYGGTEVDQQQLDATIDEVLGTLPNGNIAGMRELVYETLVVETRCGAASYQYAAENWRNYGIAQIRADTATWFLEMLFKRDRDRFSEIYKYYDPESTMERNLLVNVPFSIALCAELYAWRLKGQPIATKMQRAIAWKKHYNTPKGVGSVQGYLRRVQKAEQVDTLIAIAD